MAQYVGVLCDWCSALGIEEVPAAVQRTLALDGPPRRVDLCHRCDRALEAIADLYAAGQDLPQQAVAAGRPQRKRRRTQEEKRAQEPSQVADRRRRGGRMRDESKPSLVCPLDHPNSGGGPNRVSYSGRASHADMVHGMHFTQIAWEDPDGLLRFPCTEHEVCRDHRIAFQSQVGLTNHLGRHSTDLVAAGAAAADTPDAPVLAPVFAIPAPGSA